MPTAYNTIVSVTNNLKTDLRDGQLSIAKGSTSQNIPRLISCGSTQEIMIDGTDIENEIHGSEGTLSYLAQAGGTDERVAFQFICNNNEDNQVEMACTKEDTFNVHIQPFAPNDRPLYGECLEDIFYDSYEEMCQASYTISKPDFVEEGVKPRGFDYSDS
ncbi:hypothetical protein BGW36DRAFT_358763 [Talaromyces proteolyticus]|uniref:Uncharacterized protein n=1 Tax=Talaromyces proteolyticus TaxID=1131652 RepID=A0AAD4KY80_9EURO|nr:uncharacterized protein BGW36DRAFT_358763 [Talaromyces proteolyticus]KAH8699262.1 hypothetical protein BGW36DRAFT_358763 [Talaromyces proteolyticus]